MLLFVDSFTPAKFIPQDTKVGPIGFCHEGKGRFGLVDFKRENTLARAGGSAIASKVCFGRITQAVDCQFCLGGEDHSPIAQRMWANGSHSNHAAFWMNNGSVGRQVISG